MIDEGLQRNIDAERVRLVADDLAVAPRQIEIKGRGNTHGRGLGLGGVARKHAGRSVGEA